MSENPNFDFEAILDTKLDDVKEVLPLPAGFYNWTIGQYVEGFSSQKGTPFWEFDMHSPVPGDDVDMDAFEEAMATRTKPATLKATFYLTDAALGRLKDFIHAAGIDSNDRTFRDCLPDIVGEVVGGMVTIDYSKKSGRAYNNCDEWVKA